MTGAAGPPQSEGWHTSLQSRLTHLVDGGEFLSAVLQWLWCDSCWLSLGGGCAGISGGMSVLAGLYKWVLSLFGSWLYSFGHHQRSAEGLHAFLHETPPEGALDETEGLVVRDRYQGCQETVCRVTGVLTAMW